MFINSYKEFLTEKAKIKDKTPDHIEDYEPEEDKDEETEEEVQKYMSKVQDKCPRCGEDEDDCMCGETDPWSTQVYHRAPKGKVYKSEPKKKFKSE